jgi:hypothetical protein
MPFHYLDRISKDNEATKAVFEHFRNVATAGAVGAAGVWLTKDATFHTFRGIVLCMTGGALWIIALALFQITVTNASHRLGFSSWWKLILWVFYTWVVLGGLFTYIANR